MRKLLLGISALIGAVALVSSVYAIEPANNFVLDAEEMYINPNYFLHAKLDDEWSMGRFYTNRYNVYETLEDADNKIMALNICHKIYHGLGFRKHTRMTVLHYNTIIDNCIQTHSN